MCKRTYNIETRACRHKVETLGNLVPEDGCNNCGVEKGRNNNIASSTSHIPCDDCIEKGLWILKDGKWIDATTGGPQRFTPDFKFPCQSFLLQ